jgi:uncharacterized protein (TIRG00374 family)
MKKSVRILASIAVSVLFLWLAFRKADLSQVFVIMKSANIKLLLLAYVISVLSLMIRSYRWKLIGKDYGTYPWEYFFRATSMGLMLNIFLPFRAGDLFQSYFISKRSGLAKSYTLATVLLERFMDSIPPLLTLVVCSLFFVLPSQINVKQILLVVVALFFMLALFAFYVEEITDFVLSFEAINRFDKLKKFIENISKAVGFLKARQVLLKAVPITFFNYLVMAILSTYCVLLSMGINIKFTSVYMVLSLLMITFAIPSSPGFVGTWEFFTLFALGIFGVEKNRALSYALISHFMVLFPVLSVGAIYFAKEMIWGQLTIKNIESVEEGAD